MLMNRVARLAGLLCMVAGTAGAQSFPPAGIDEFNITMVVSFYSDTNCIMMGDMRLPVGVIALKRGVPTDPGDGLDEVPLEIVSLSLADETLSITEAPGGSDPDDAGDPPCTVGAAS